MAGSRLPPEVDSLMQDSHLEENPRTCKVRALEKAETSHIAPDHATVDSVVLLGWGGI
jgi:hypothetical protein